MNINTGEVKIIERDDGVQVKVTIMAASDTEVSFIESSRILGRHFSGEHEKMPREQFEERVR